MLVSLSFIYLKYCYGDIVVLFWGTILEGRVHLAPCTAVQIVVWLNRKPCAKNKLCLENKQQKIELFLCMSFSSSCFQEFFVLFCFDWFHFYGLIKIYLIIFLVFILFWVHWPSCICNFFDFYKFWIVFSHNN